MWRSVEDVKMRRVSRDYVVGHLLTHSLAYLLC